MKSVELDSIINKHRCRWDRSIHTYPGEQEKHTNSPWMIILNYLPQMPSWELCNNRGMRPICELTKANNYTQVCLSNQPWVQRLFVFQALVWCWKAEYLLLRFKDLEHDLFILGNWRLFFVNASFRVIPFATADSFSLRPLASQWVRGAEAALAWRVENKALSPPDTHTYTRQISTERTNIRNFTAGRSKARRQKKS